MRRIHTMFAAVAPLLLAGALLGGSAAPTRADDGSDVTQDVSDDDNDAADNKDDAQAAMRAAHDAQRDAMHEARDAVRQARDEAREELRKARDQVMHDKSIPPAIREMVLKRIDQAAKVVADHLDKAANAGDLGAMTAELSAMGAELGQTMGGVSGDMQKMQKDMAKMGRDMAKGFGKNWKFHFDNGGASASAGDDDNDNDSADSDSDSDADVFVIPTPPTPPTPPMPPMPPMPPAAGMHGGMDIDMSDLDVNVNLDDLQLSQQQRDQLEQILSQEQTASEQAEQQISGLSDGLRGLLEDSNASEGDITRMVDQINAAEGSYRKERILSWARARKVLNEQQRDELIKASRHHHGHHSH